MILPLSWQWQVVIDGRHDMRHTLGRETEGDQGQRLEQSIGAEACSGTGTMHRGLWVACVWVRFAATEGWLSFFPPTTRDLQSLSLYLSLSLSLSPTLSVSLTVVLSFPLFLPSRPCQIHTSVPETLSHQNLSLSKPEVMSL